jgi:hypothetical protein
VTDPDRLEQLANGLANNPLLEELFADRSAQIREDWEAEQTVEGRERLWIELKTLNDVRDFINARIESYRRGAG